MFKDLLTPEQRRRIERFDAQKKAFAEMSDEDLAVAATYIRGNSQCQYVAGEMVYDATLFHAVIPELIRRLSSGTEVEGVADEGVTQERMNASAIRWW